jgi:hypothetical protein
MPLEYVLTLATICIMETEILRLFKFLGSEFDEGEKQEFSVTADQVVAYVKQHGLPESLYEIPPSRMDGLHLTEVDGQYVVYSQERGYQSEGKRFSTKEDAMAHLTLMILEHFTWSGFILLKDNTFDVVDTKAFTQLH